MPATFSVGASDLKGVITGTGKLTFTFPDGKSVNLETDYSTNDRLKLMIGAGTKIDVTNSLKIQLDGYLGDDEDLKKLQSELNAGASVTLTIDKNVDFKYSVEANTSGDIKNSVGVTLHFG